MKGSLQEGASTLFAGARWIVGTPRLWPLAAAPIAIAAVSFAAAVFGGIELVRWADARWLSGWHGASAALRWAILVVGYVVAIALCYLVAKTLVLPVAAGPFNELISECVEELSTGRPLPSRPLGEMLRATAIGAWRALATALFGLAVRILGFPLNWIPVVGWVFYLMIPKAYAEALNALDATFGRKGMTLAAKRRWMREHRSAAMGFGGAIVLVNLVPPIGFFFVPAAAAGGALLVLKKGDTVAVHGR